MIDKRELRYDNWVQPKDYPPMLVKTIGYEIGLYMPNSESDLWGYEPEQINPIPLTPELLVKCGFKMSITGELELRLNSVLMLTCVPNVSDVYLWYSANDMHMCLTDNSYQHLHQLQNLFFALTQTELKIEL